MQNSDLTKWNVIKNSPKFNGSEFLKVIKAVGWSDETILNTNSLDDAIKATPAHYTIWENETLIGLARVFTDHYLFSSIPEIMILPEWQKRELVSLLWSLS